MTAAAQLVKALQGRWHGSYGLCRCPVHDDGKTPALKVSDDPRKSDGIDLICFAGCDWRAVKAALRQRGLLAGARDSERPLHRPTRVVDDRPADDAAAKRAAGEVIERLRLTLAQARGAA